MVYMELQFSRYKELKLKNKEEVETLKPNGLIELERRISTFISDLYEMEFRLERFDNSEVLLLRSKFMTFSHFSHLF